MSKVTLHRPYGTRIFFCIVPSTSCWAIVQRPYGTNISYNRLHDQTTMPALRRSSSRSDSSDSVLLIE